VNSELLDVESREVEVERRKENCWRLWIYVGYKKRTVYRWTLKGEQYEVDKKIQQQAGGYI
jgi:hypothetical protein